MSELIAKVIMRRRRPIRKVSKARAGQLREYVKAKAGYLEGHPYCFSCGFRMEYSERILHHFYKRRGKLLVWVPGFRTVCVNCHDDIHYDEPYARKMGWLAPKECCDDFKRAQEHYGNTARQ